MSGFRNPLFTKPKPEALAKAEAETAAATGTVPPTKSLMSGGGMLGGMMKSMGIDPVAVDETFGKFLTGLEELNKRLDRIEAEQALTTKSLAAIYDQAARTERMLQDMLAGLAQ